MKIKKIMLITFLLLTVLAIGAVSAAENVSSDNMTVSDDVDVIVDDDDEDYYGIEITEYDIIIDDEDDDYDDIEQVADITLPQITKGSFQILNGEDIVTQLDVDDAVIARLDDEDGDENWEVDEEDGTFTGTIYMSDFNLAKVHNGDVLSFKFFKLVGKNYVEEKSYTKMCNVILTDSTMRLIEAGHSGMTEDDVDIQVTNIDTTKPDENFTYVDVAQKVGVFIITVEGEDDDAELIIEDLNTTVRPYEIIEKNGNSYYRFGFSFADIVNYIQKLEYSDFNDLVAHEGVESGNEIYFELYEDDEETEIYSKTMIINLDQDELIVFEEENEDVDVDYGNLEIIMYDGWNETEVIEFEVSTEINGKIVIYLNETLAFEKAISEFDPDDSEEDEDYKHYSITLADLKITHAGEYVIRDYFYDENDKIIYHYDYEDPEVLVLYEAQIITVDNVTIDVNPIPATITGNETLITIIDESASDDDVALVYVDGNETPIPINITKCRIDEDGGYIIGAKELGLGVGQHNLNITYKSIINHTGNVTLFSNLVIEIIDDETIYTTFNDIFVLISLDDAEDIRKTEGIINLTMIDKDGKIIAISKNIEDLYYYGEDNAYAIRAGDMDAELNGTYTVTVKYFNDNEGTTQVEGNVTFKSFTPTEYGTSIKDTIKDKNDYVITFTDLPLYEDIIVEIDGNYTKNIAESILRNQFDSKGVYYITYNQLGKVADGHHSISVYLDNDEHTELSSGNIFVDVEENFDIGLKIDVNDIEEGKIANVIITTNSTFTGDILVQVANVNHTVNVVNGQGNLSITGLKADTYIATAIFKTNGIFADSTKTTTFKVISKSVAPATPTTPAKKANVIKLTLKNVKIKKSAKKLVLKATLKINGKAVKGKKVTFKFKGKTYKAKTNKKGIAKVTIKKKVLKKLKVGKKVTYSAKYLTKTAKKTVKVKK